MTNGKMSASLTGRSSALDDKAKKGLADELEHYCERLTLMQHKIFRDAIAALRDPSPYSGAAGEAKWYAVDEVGNDNFATSIYEAGDKGLLVARCNQNGKYPWQAASIIRGLKQNIATTLPRDDAERETIERCAEIADAVAEGAASPNGKSRAELIAKRIRALPSIPREDPK